MTSSCSERLFLQSYLNIRHATMEESEKLYEKCCRMVRTNQQESSLSEDSFLDFILHLNNKISFFDLEFRQLHHPFNGTPWMTLCNTNGDDIAQMATDLTPQEIQFFKKLVKLIMTESSDTFEISSLEILNLSSTGNFSKKDVQDLVEKLIKSKWLSERDGKVCLGMRSTVELTMYFKKEYPHFFYRCNLCKEIALNDHERCEDINCSVKLHMYCREKYFARTGQNKCPSCSKDWVMPQSKSFKKNRIIERLTEEIGYDDTEDQEMVGTDSLISVPESDVVRKQRYRDHDDDDENENMSLSSIPSPERSPISEPKRLRRRR